MVLRFSVPYEANTTGSGEVLRAKIHFLLV